VTVIFVIVSVNRIISRPVCKNGLHIQYCVYYIVLIGMTFVSFFAQPLFATYSNMALKPMLAILICVMAELASMEVHLLVS